MAYNTNTAGDVTPGTNGQSAQYNDLRASLLNGWYSITDTWTYSSVTGLVGVITIPTDGTTFYQVGMTVRFKQGGAYKYFNIIAVSATTISITGGIDYTLANAGITNIAVSSNPNPYGFPNVFNFTVTYANASTFTNNPTTNSGYFWIIGKICYFFVQFTYGNPSGGSGFTRLTGLPVVPIDSNGVANVSNASSAIAGTVILYNSGNIDIYKYDGSTYIGNAQGVQVAGFFKFI